MRHRTSEICPFFFKILPFNVSEKRVKKGNQGESTHSTNGDQSNCGKQHHHHEGYLRSAEGSDPTFFITALVHKMQRMSILLDGHVKAAEVFSARPCVIQYTIKQIAITLIQYAHLDSVTPAYTLGKILNHSLLVASRIPCRLQFPLYGSFIATLLFQNCPIRLQTSLD